MIGSFVASLHQFARRGRPYCGLLPPNARKGKGGKDQGEKLARGGHSEKVPAVNQLLTVLWPIPTRSPTGCALMSVHW